MDDPMSNDTVEIKERKIAPLGVIMGACRPRGSLRLVTRHSRALDMAFNRSASKSKAQGQAMHRRYLVPSVIPWDLSRDCLSATHCNLLSTPSALHDSLTILRGSCTTALGTRMLRRTTLLVFGGSAGVCRRFGFLLECCVQRGLLGRQHKGSTAGDGGIDEVHQSVGLIAAPEGQTGRHMCTEGQQPAVMGPCHESGRRGGKGSSGGGEGG